MRAPPVVLPLVLAACAAGQPAPPSAEEATPPFTREQLRGAFPGGSRFTLEMEMGGTTKRVTTTFVTVDEEKAELETVESDASGQPLAAAERGSSTWDELLGHARFPRAKTKIEDTTLDAPLGRFDCWLYTVQREEQGQPFEMRFYFAKKLPGPPVRFERWQGGQRVMQALMVERTPLALLP